MHLQRVLASLGACALLTVGVTSSSSAQAGFRSAAGARLTQETTTSNPRITLYGGLATGDGSFGVGPALAASFRWELAEVPFDLRVDPYFASHSLDDGDGSIWFLGASGNIEFPFRTADSNTEPYLFGGLGLYFNSVSIDVPGDGSVDDTGFDSAFGLGGGVRFGGLTLEAKMRDIDEFTTVSFLVGFMLGGR